MCINKHNSSAIAEMAAQCCTSRIFAAEWGTGHLFNTCTLSQSSLKNIAIRNNAENYTLEALKNLVFGIITYGDIPYCLQEKCSPYKLRATFFLQTLWVAYK